MVQKIMLNIDFCVRDHFLATLVQRSRVARATKLYEKMYSFWEERLHYKVLRKLTILYHMTT